MLDRYVWGDAQRVSPEAPVPVVHARTEEARAGGAGNVAANVCELGGGAHCFGVLGADADGEALLGLLGGVRAELSGLLRLPGRPTTQKIRIMARNQQMLRVDREDAQPLPESAAHELLRRLRAASWDVLVLSDYGKGVLGEAVCAGAIAEARRRGAPSLVDPKQRDFRRYRGATVVTPNRAEAEAAAGEPLPGLEALAQAGERLCAVHELSALLVTLGPGGMLLLRAGAAPLHVPTDARAVFDVTGAGDTALSMLALALGSALDWETSIGLANAAAGLKVGKVGTATVGRDELLHHLSAETPAHKIAGAGTDGVRAALEVLRREARKLVFTNGVFDILHAGHVRYLQEARRLGDALVVGVNDDDSVKRLKGDERPFNPLQDRMEVLAALECVDLVVPFGEDTPERLIRAVCPDVLVKGADWKDKGVVGAEFVQARGGEVRLIDLLPGRSTTAIARKIRGR
ncbi:MAG: D-glycero-beta-D-manno-heptose 1-phosphate adenylyltransferase [Planctomycetota bacterium]|nr:MAG: D-glycero-beta-D-manno-heptose 1-phosphate adenylyltransferase [Planctomycetota bacterium]